MPKIVPATGSGIWGAQYPGCCDAEMVLSEKIVESAGGFFQLSGCFYG